MAGLRLDVRLDLGERGCRVFVVGPADEAVRSVTGDAGEVVELPVGGRNFPQVINDGLVSSNVTHMVNRTIREPALDGVHRLVEQHRDGPIGCESLFDNLLKELSIRVGLGQMICSIRHG